MNRNYIFEPMLNKIANFFLKNNILESLECEFKKFEKVDMNEENLDKFKNFIGEIENKVKNFDMKISLYDSLILYAMYTTQNRKLKDYVREDLSFKNKSNAIYLDYNVLQDFENDKDVINQLINEKNFFVYSPIHAEEVIRATEKKDCIIQKNKVINIISKYFSNILVIEQDNRVYKEDFENSIERAINNPIQRIVDIVKVLDFYELSPSPIRDAIKNYLNQIKVNNITLNNLSIQEILTKFPKLKEYFDDIMKDTLSFNSQINSLFSFLDYIGYFSEKNAKRFKSSFYDCLHVEYAEGTKYFITKDKKLAKRAEVIYNFLNIRTGVYFLNKNKLELKKEYNLEISQ